MQWYILHQNESSQSASGISRHHYVQDAPIGSAGGKAPFFAGLKKSEGFRGDHMFQLCLVQDFGFILTGHFFLNQTSPCHENFLF